MRTIVPRWLLGLFALTLVITLVGSALLWSYTVATAHKNSAFICAFGAALNQIPAKQRAEETNAEFRKRIALSRDFVDDLNALDGCEGQPPARIRVHPDSRDSLTPREERTGVPPSEPPDSP